MHQGANYNCRVLFYNRDVLMIRPKMVLANGGNYREARWFKAWPDTKSCVPFRLPEEIECVRCQKETRFGAGVIAAGDVCVGVEMCEELFVPDCPHIHMGMEGVHVFLNGSSSYHEVGKLAQRIRLIQNATSKVRLCACWEGRSAGCTCMPTRWVVMVSGSTTMAAPLFP
jgi:NAD+ synthase (glutamine-hydrolysing)